MKREDIERKVQLEQRIREYIHLSGRSQAATARKLGYKPERLNKWLRGINAIPIEAIQSLCNLFQLNSVQRAELYDLAGYAIVLSETTDAPSTLSAQKSLLQDGHPKNYIPLFRNPLFQPRPNEFEQIEALLFGTGTKQKAPLIGLVGIGMIGLGGVGKTQLAVQVSYRYEQRFPAGVFWMSAMGNNRFEWQRHLAELALQTGYLPPHDDTAYPENEERRARYFCEYLAKRQDALLILDNVEDPNLITSVLPALAGREMACTILYTSRIRRAPTGVRTYTVDHLSEVGALQILLGDTRPTLLTKVLAGSQGKEAKAARTICRCIGYLPLALIHVHGILVQNPDMQLVNLAHALITQGALHVGKTHNGDAAPLFATFMLSWKQILTEEARRLFKLASTFPEAELIPLWMLGLAAGLGESNAPFTPLWEARIHVQERSLMEELSGEQVNLHPLVREFGKQLLAEDDLMKETLLNEAIRRLIDEFADLAKLERRARAGFWECLKQIRMVRAYLEVLGTDQVGQLKQVERWLTRESNVLGDKRWWPETLPGLFGQQFYNRMLEEDQSQVVKHISGRWLRQMNRVGAENRFLLKTFSVSSAPMWHASFSPDGTTILTCSEDGRMRLWETSGALLMTWPYHHYIGVRSPHFSPDGSRLLIEIAEEGVCLVDTNSGDILVKLVEDLDWGRSGMSAAAFSPDGDLVLTGSALGNAVHFWEALTGKLLATRVGHTENETICVKSVVFSPGSNMIISVSEYGTACLWSVMDGQLLKVFHGHQEPIKSAAFSPHGDTILTSSEDTTYLWGIVNNRELGILHAFGGSSAEEGALFSPDGTLILTSSSNSEAELRDVVSGRQLRILQGHYGAISHIAFSPDGKKIALVSSQRIVYVWETQSGHLLVQLDGHTNTVTGVAFSPDGEQVITSSLDGTARLWEIRRSQNASNLQGHLATITCVAFSPDSRLAITGSDDYMARLWDVTSGQLVHVFGNWLDQTGEGHNDSVSSVAFSPDGNRVLTGSWDGKAWLWDIESGKPLQPFRGQFGAVRGVAFSPDGSMVAVSSDDGVVRLFRTRGKEAPVEVRGHLGWVECIAFSTDTSWMLTGSLDMTARLWAVYGGRALFTFEGHSAKVNCVAISPDRTRVLTGSEDGTARLWETESGHVLEIFSDHVGPVTNVAFSPDGRLVITCDQHCHMFLWQIDGTEAGKLLGMYVTAYEIGAVQWQSLSSLLIADKGGLLYYPHFYRLKLEGYGVKWFYKSRH